MVTPDPSRHIAGRLDHANPEKAEENNLKHNFVKMTETIKEEMENSLKERGEKTKYWKKLINPSKKAETKKTNK